VIPSAGPSGHAEHGKILRASGTIGEPPFLVQWNDGRIETVVPGPEDYVEHYTRLATYVPPARPHLQTSAAAEARRGHGAPPPRADAVPEAIEHLRSVLTTLPMEVDHATGGLARFYGDAALFSLQGAVIALEDFERENTSGGQA
jgi:hypothetical protein